MSIADTLRRYDVLQSDANGHHIQDAVITTVNGVIRGHVALSDDETMVNVNRRLVSYMGGTTLADPLATIVASRTDAGTEDYSVAVALAHIVMVSPVGAAEFAAVSA
jgi:hypothetical protein